MVLTSMNNKPLRERGTAFGISVAREKSLCSKNTHDVKKLYGNKCMMVRETSIKTQPSTSANVKGEGWVWTFNQAYDEPISAFVSLLQAVEVIPSRLT
jgi:hypothetical protein